MSLTAEQIDGMDHDTLVKTASEYGLDCFAPPDGDWSEADADLRDALWREVMKADRTDCKLAARLERGEIHLDPRELLLSFTDEEQLALMEQMAFSTVALDVFCAWLTEGRYDGRDGLDFWTYSTGKDSTCIENAKKRLLPLMPEIAQKFIADLIQQRDHYYDLSEQWKSFAWQLERAWPPEDIADGPRSAIDHSRPRFTKEQARERLEKFAAEHPTEAPAA